MPRPSADLTGQRFGKLTVMHRQRIRYGAYGWLCRCDCGREIAVVTSSLNRGLTRSCGCTRVSPFAKPNHGYRRPTYADLTGKTFGRLTVIRLAGSAKGKRQWLCRCVCREQRIVLTSNLTRGNTTSCGCQRRDNAKVLLAPGVKPTYPRYCRRCGSAFLATARQSYCSPACANYRDPAKTHCLICGAICAAANGSRYCGAACRAAAKKQHATTRTERERHLRVAQLGAELERRLNQREQSGERTHDDQ